MTIASELCGPYVASGRSMCTGWSPVSKSTRPSSVRRRPDHTGMRTISAPPSGKKVERGRSMSPVRSSVSSSRRRAYAPAMRDGREPQCAGELPDLILGGQDGPVNLLGLVRSSCLPASARRSRALRRSTGSRSSSCSRCRPAPSRTWSRASSGERASDQRHGHPGDHGIATAPRRLSRDGSPLVSQRCPHLCHALQGAGGCIPRAPGGPVDLDRYPLRGGSRVDQVKRSVRAGGGE